MKVTKLLLLATVFTLFAGPSMAQQAQQPQRGQTIQPPQGQQPQAQQVPAERYRARIVGQTIDGGPLAISTTYEWPSRGECQAAAEQPPVGDLVDKLAKSGAVQNLSVQCRKMPARTTNATPNVPGGQGTSANRQSATVPVFEGQPGQGGGQQGAPQQGGGGGR